MASPVTRKPLDPAEAAKFTAEAEALKALARKHAAEAEKLESEARSASLQARAHEIELSIAERLNEEELAKNSYFHIYSFTSPVSEGSVKSCMTELQTWSRLSPGCPIEVIFTSPGGDVIAGFALFDFLKSLQRPSGDRPAHTVTTTALGMAASMAGILLQAGGTRVMTKESWLMIHEASFGAHGKIGEVEDTVEWVKRVQLRILDIFAERSKLSKATIARKWKRKDWWLSSDQALAAGFIDEIR